MQNSLVPNQGRYDSEAISFPVVCGVPVSWGKINLQRANNFKAIVNPETGKVFSIVSNDYKLIRHEEAVQKIERTIDDYPDLGNYRTETRFYNDGGRMRRTYRFYEKPVKIKSGDSVNPELQLFNSYDTSWPFIVILGAFRIVCSNGLVVGEKYMHLRKRHVYDFTQIEIKKVVSTALKRLKLQTSQWEKWADKELTEKSYFKVMKVMKVGKKAAEIIEDRISQDASGFTDNRFPIMSIWIFYNVLTWYITHRAVSLNHRVEMERRLRSAMKYWV